MRLRRGAQGGESGPEATDDHGEDLVELTRVAFIAEAVAIRQDLERIGVAAVVFESDAGGWAPHFGVEQGQRVMVHARDVDKAKVMLSDSGGQVAVEPPPRTLPIRKHLRPREGG